MTAVFKNLVGISLVALLLFATLPTAQASLLTNGTFDTNLSGWTIAPGTTTGVTWDAATAHIGRPGTPGVAIFEQSFDIPTNFTFLNISFDYEWQATPPPNADTFTVEFEYESNSGTVSQTLVSELSSSATFNSVTSFHSLLALPGLANVSNNGTIRFTLNEVNSPVGTRIQLDNVSAIGAVPEATTFATWSILTGLGLFAGRRRGRD